MRSVTQYADRTDPTRLFTHEHGCVTLFSRYMDYEAHRSTLKSPTVNDSKVKVAARIVIVPQQQRARGIR